MDSYLSPYILCWATWATVFFDQQGGVYVPRLEKVMPDGW